MATVLALGIGILTMPQAPPIAPALHIVVLLDFTASVGLDAVSARATLAAFETGFVGHLRDGDRVRLGSISARAGLSTPASDPKELLARARQLFAGPVESRYGPSPIWDCVSAAVQALAKEDGRRAIVLHSDGRSTGDALWREDVVRSAAAAGVSIVVISTPGFKAEAQLMHAAKATGGVYLRGYLPNQRDPRRTALGDAFTKALNHVHRP